MTLCAATRARPALSLAALLVLVLAACASLPESGPVRQGDPDVTEPGSIALLARLPEPDDGPREIVEGFLRAAAAGLTDDFVIAREFLAGPVRSSWDPLARVDVYAGQPVASVDGEGSIVEISAAASALIDDKGRYAQVPSGATVRLSFGLARDEGGLWRIHDLANGMLLSEPIFESLFQQVPLYFATPGNDALVPETRWYPRRTVETAAVAGLLGGPSPWLAEGVASRFPPGTRLLPDTVAVRDGVAQVRLSREARETSPADRSVMMAQLRETLGGLPRVASVLVTADDSALAGPDPPRDLVIDPTVGTTPVVLAGDDLREVHGSELVPWRETERITASNPSHPGVSLDSGSAVVLSDGTDVVTVPGAGEEERTLLAGEERLTPPSFDLLDWIWTATVSGSRVNALRVDGTRVAVDADWLAGREVRSLRVSREGARVVVLSVVDGRVRLEVAAVERNQAGTPIALRTPLQIGQRVARASSAVWVDQQTVAVLGSTGEGSTDTVVLAVVGGPTSALPAVDGAASLAAGKGDRLIVVSTASGVLYIRNGLGWAPTVRGVRDPTFPG